MIRVASILGILVLCAVYIAPEVYAAQFQPMVGVPGLDTSENYTLIQLINRLYIFLIAIGAVIGVIKIAFAGVKWATSASGGSISAAKEDIKGVLLGLVILMVPYIVLSIINPNFTNLDVLKLQPLDLPQSSSPGSSGGGGVTVDPKLPEALRQCGGCIAPDNNKGNCQQYSLDCLVSANNNPNPQVGLVPPPHKVGDTKVFSCTLPKSALCPKDTYNTTEAQCSGMCTKYYANIFDDRDILQACAPYIDQCKEVGGREDYGHATSTLGQYGYVICLLAENKHDQCPKGSTF